MDRVTFWCGLVTTIWNIIWFLVLSETAKAYIRNRFHRTATAQQSLDYVKALIALDKEFPGRTDEC